MNCDELANNVANQRNRYFPGKLITARDLRDEQAYFLTRHRLQNRLKLGWGIVSGLKVTADTSPGCPKWLAVSGGLAIDSMGREVIHLGQGRIEFEKESAAADLVPYDAADDEKADLDAGDSPAYLLCIEYLEIDVDPVGVLDPYLGCKPNSEAASRVQELAVLKLIRWRPKHQCCWPRPKCPPIGKTPGCCGDTPCSPHCLCSGNYIPLALVKWVHDKLIIETDNRRYIGCPPLTSICGVNWKHGEATTVHDLNKRVSLPAEPECKPWAPNHAILEIKFSGEILRPENDCGGLGRFFHTLFVEKYDTNMRREEIRPAQVCLSGGDTLLIELDRWACEVLENDWVRVTLHCDFIEDRHGFAVDGNFIRGQFPTGNGVAGGDFVSWFKLVPNHKHHQDKE